MGIVDVLVMVLDVGDAAFGGASVMWCWPAVAAVIFTETAEMETMGLPPSASVPADAKETTWTWGGKRVPTTVVLATRLSVSFKGCCCSCVLILLAVAVALTFTVS